MQQRREGKQHEPRGARHAHLRPSEQQATGSEPRAIVTQRQLPRSEFAYFAARKRGRGEAGPNRGRSETGLRLINQLRQGGRLQAFKAYMKARKVVLRAGSSYADFAEHARAPDERAATGAAPSCAGGQEASGEASGRLLLRRQQASCLRGQGMRRGEGAGEQGPFQRSG